MDHQEMRTRFPDLITTKQLIVIRIHGMVLIISSVIGFTGHLIQFGIPLWTPWIPAAAGFLIIFVNERAKQKKGLARNLPLIPTLIFGIVTSLMCIKFLPQQEQPIRKKILFTIMSTSAWITISSTAWKNIKCLTAGKI